MITNLGLRTVGEVETTEPLLDGNGFHVVEGHVLPGGKDLNFEIVQITIHRGGRTANIRIAKLMQLKMSPGIGDGDGRGAARHPHCR